MLTSKQRAHLRSIAQSYNTIFFVGKLGIGDELVKQLDDRSELPRAYKGRRAGELRVHRREAADQIAELTKSEVVQVIGRKFVLYRRNKDPKKRVIELE